MHPINLALARRLERLARLLELRGDEAYKIRAYLRAAETLESLPEPITHYAEAGTLTQLPGIGPAIARKIREFLETGEIATLKRVQQEVPVTLLELLNLPGLGPSRVRRLWQELGVVDLDSLEAALRAGRVRGLAGFGAKTEARLLAALERYKARPRGHLLAHALDLARMLLPWLRDIPGVQRAQLAGDARRWVPYPARLDLAVAADRSPEDLLPLLLAHPLLEQGRTEGGRLLLWDFDGFPVVVHLTAEAAFGTFWLYLTGSPAHVQALEREAAARGLGLSPEGLHTGEGLRTVAEEEDVYQALGLPWIPPELRQGRDELDLARAGRLDDVLPWEAVQADLHMHSDWSDGAASLREMVQAAWESGLRVVAITDHSPVQKVARGLSVSRLRQQRREIEALRREFEGRIHILHGAEVDILEDGTLDYPDDVLEWLDLVVASPHLHLDQDAETATARLVRAVMHPRVRILGHPRGKMWPRRPGLPVDIRKVAEAAAAHGTALELNANPYRLDLGEEDLAVVREVGAWVSINTDAHSPQDFGYRLFGIALARRARLSARQVVNAWPTEGLLAWVRGEEPTEAPLV